jgi:hypothetical protein
MECQLAGLAGSPSREKSHILTARRGAIRRQPERERSNRTKAPTGFAKRFEPAAREWEA